MRNADPLLTDRYAGILGRWVAKHVFRQNIPAPPAPPKLSPRAQAVYDRLLAGEFYTMGDPRTPKSMQELIDLGLVSTMGRVITVQACYVPSGSIPLEFEKIRP